MSLKVKNLWPISLALIPTFGHALPVDWHGAFGVDSTMITDYRRINSKTDNVPATTGANQGSQEVKLSNGNKDTTSFQSYILKLAPEVVINDAATLKLEMTTGYANGGFLGDSAQTDKNASGNADLFYYNQAAASGLNIKKAYADIVSDTAEYYVGRHTFHWGLGALFNDGKNVWDRHAYSRDGISAFFKFDNFYMTPFWSGTSNPGYTRATDSKEFGSSFLYDNKERDIAFGIYYSKKSSNAYNNFYQSNASGANFELGANNVKVTDIYFKKIFGRFDMALEVPLIDGDLGHFYSANGETKFSAKAILFQSNYKASDAWTFGVDAGTVSGNDASDSKFGALYLNPNFQIANLLFKYNVAAFGATDASRSVYDSYLNNATYAKARATFNTEKWIFDGAFIWAKANQVATAGSNAYNHMLHRRFTANFNQSDKLGYEFDFSGKYKWNKEMSIGTNFGYLMTGDYFAYTNSAISNKAKDSVLMQINTSIEF